MSDEPKLSADSKQLIQEALQDAVIGGVAQKHVVALRAHVAQLEKEREQWKQRAIAAENDPINPSNRYAPNAPREAR